MVVNAAKKNRPRTSPLRGPAAKLGHTNPAALLLGHLLASRLAIIVAAAAGTEASQPTTEKKATGAAAGGVFHRNASDPQTAEAFPFAPVDGVDVFALHGNPTAPGVEPGRPTPSVFTVDCFAFVHAAVAKVYPKKVTTLSGLVRPLCQLPNAQVCDELADSLQQLVTHKQSEKAGVVVTSSGSAPKRYDQWCAQVGEEMLGRGRVAEQVPKANETSSVEPGTFDQKTALRVANALRGAGSSQKELRSSSKGSFGPAAAAPNANKAEDVSEGSLHAAKARKLLDEFTTLAKADAFAAPSAGGVNRARTQRAPVVFDDSALRREAAALRVKRAAERLAAVGSISLKDAEKKVADEEKEKATNEEVSAPEAGVAAPSSVHPSAPAGTRASKKEKKTTCACVHRDGKKVCHCHAPAADA